MVSTTPNFYAIVAVLMSIIHISMTHSKDEIKKYVYNTNGFGSYSFEYETSDGTYRREAGGIETANKAFAVRGGYGYMDPMGHYHSVRYVADINGFQPQTYDDDTRFNDRNII